MCQVEGGNLQSPHVLRAPTIPHLHRSSDLPKGHRSRTATAREGSAHHVCKNSSKRRLSTSRIQSKRFMSFEVNVISGGASSQTANCHMEHHHVIPSTTQITLMGPKKSGNHARSHKAQGWDNNEASVVLLISKCWLYVLQSKASNQPTGASSTSRPTCNSLPKRLYSTGFLRPHSVTQHPTPLATSPSMAMAPGSFQGFSDCCNSAWPDALRNQLNGMQGAT